MNPIPTLWSPPPTQPDLVSGQVHLWRFRLDLPATGIEPLRQILSADEQARAERLLDRGKADRFIVARARTRQILARTLGRKPEEIGFSYGEQGKPSLHYPTDRPCEFNLAHAGDWGVLALASGGTIGVDIEQIDRQLDAAQVAANFFSPAEIARLADDPPMRRQRGFYRIWTRKEASLKAAGSGFSTPRIDGCETGWQLRPFVIGRDYLGALAASEEIISLQRWDFDPEEQGQGSANGIAVSNL